MGHDHIVWFVIDVIEGLDATALQALGKPGKGRPGYDPRMLAVLLIYAYLQAERSSRKIEARCRTDAAFRIATGNLIPDHSTICRFRAAAAAEGGPLEDLFTKVLFVLAVAGLGRLDVISVDGSKIWANASKGANRTEDGLRRLARRILDEAARADGEDCICEGHEHGEAAGLDGLEACGCCDAGTLPGLGLDGPAVPRGGWGGAPRAARIAAGLAELEAARLAQEQQRRAAAEEYLAAARAGQAPAGRAPADVAVEAAQLRLEQAITARQAQAAAWEQAAASGRVPRGRRPSGDGKAVSKAREQLAAATKSREEAAARAAAPAGKKEPRPVRNITDPDSRVLHCTLRGAVQAYNCQVPRTGDGVFLFPRAVQDANDADQVQAAFEAIARSRQVIAAGHAAADRPGLWSRIGTVLFDPGYFSRANIEATGPDRLIGTGAWKDPGPHSPGCDHDDPRDQMHHNLSTRQGRDLYRRRAPVSEGGFADLKERTGLRQFAMRGIGKVQGELLLACAAANIDLLYRRIRLA
ncbi:MAG TPA: transposase [Streptosporangiaceae bacterium]|nr:transposase [Streptosporangiaceae bacterium]